MKAMKPATKRRRSTRPPPPSVGGANVLALDARRIERAIEQRTRYKYVRPRVEREGLGWKVVSPNCSRNIDAEGGEIDIAWLVPHAEDGWLLYSRDHRQDCWQLRQHDTLPALLEQLSADTAREFWV